MLFNIAVGGVSHDSCLMLLADPCREGEEVGQFRHHAGFRVVGSLHFDVQT